MGLREPGAGEILGGRYDGHVVEYHGERVQYQGEFYVALVREDGFIFYLLETMADQWFKFSH